jgi:hypothetical protein
MTNYKIFNLPNKTMTDRERKDTAIDTATIEEFVRIAQEVQMKEEALARGIAQARESVSAERLLEIELDAKIAREVQLKQEAAAAGTKSANVDSRILQQIEAEAKLLRELYYFREINHI